MLVQNFIVQLSRNRALRIIELSGKWVRSFESYMSWCQIHSRFNLSTIITFLHAVALIMIILVCQAYIMFKASNNTYTCAVIIKHTFVAFIFIVASTIHLTLIYNIQLIFKNAIPYTIHLFVIVPLFINIGFLIKERESTFPIIENLIKNPCTSINTVTPDLPSMYPDWLEMYPVHE